MRRLPSPCEECRRAGRCRDMGCKQYRAWIDAQWQRLNGRFMEAYGAGLSSDKFYYAHPEEVRRYLRQGVCHGCPAERVCGSPCPVYWRWWDARMEIARKKGENPTF